MSFKLLKSALFFIIIAMVGLNVAAGAGLTFVGFPMLMERVYFDQSVVIDDNARVYVRSSCLEDWANSNSAASARSGKMSEAYRLQYEQYECDTRAHWRSMFPARYP